MLKPAMEQTLNADVRNTLKEDSQLQPDTQEEDLCFEFTRIRKGCATLAQTSAIQKHGLHILSTGVQADLASQNFFARKENSQVFSESEALPTCLAGRSLDAALERLRKHYAAEACVVAVEDGSGIRVLAKQGILRGIDFNLENTSHKTKGGFQFFRHHIERDLPIIIADASKQCGLEDHPLVAGGPHIAFYAAAPLIIRRSSYAGTLSIFDSKPRHNFSLQDANTLQQIASEIVEILRQLRGVG